MRIPIGVRVAATYVSGPNMAMALRSNQNWAVGPRGHGGVEWRGCLLALSYLSSQVLLVVPPELPLHLLFGQRVLPETVRVHLLRAALNLRALFPVLFKVSLVGCVVVCGEGGLAPEANSE